MNSLFLLTHIGVLAAASSFFAALLPDCELELDVCISTDLTCEEMFCVLEYIYSGKLLCSAEIKDRILSILKDFNIFVPNRLYDPDKSQNDSAALEDTVDLEDSSIDDSQAVPSKPDFEDFQLVLGGEESADEQNPPTKTSAALKMYCNKSKNLPQENLLNLDLTLRRSNIEIDSLQPLQDMEPDGFLGVQLPAIPSEYEENSMEETLAITNPRLPDRDSVTIQFPSQLYNQTVAYSNQLELSAMKRTTPHYFVSASYPLHLYHSHTWCYGVYTPVDPSDLISFETNQFDDPLANKKGTPIVHDWTSFRQPTFLVSRPLRVYGRRRDKMADPSTHSKAVLKLTDIRNMKAFKGKIHVTLNGQPPVLQTSLPEIFHGTSDKESNRPGRRPMTNGGGVAGESETDKIDLALAKHFLQEEVRTKQKLQLRLRMFSERLAQ